MKNDIDWENYLARFHFDLPEDLIARYPAPEREKARLLVVDRNGRDLHDGRITDLPQYLRKGDLLVRNTTRVSPRRVLLRRENGVVLPVLFLEEREPGLWSVLLRGAKKIKKGEALRTEGDDSSLVFLFQRTSREETESLLRPLLIRPDGSASPAWEDPADAEEYFQKNGKLPITPYLKREAEELDRVRYQTVFAERPGSVAAPTAGLHFTPDLLGALEKRGILFCDVELKIGYGTFAPLKPENLESKRLHTERYTITEETANMLNDPSRPRRIALGTTSLRAMESNYRAHDGIFTAGSFETSLFITPPDLPRSADVLLTNFHLPESSLFMLVCAFGGEERIMEAYRYAIEKRYRFFSYGDAMLIL